MEKDRDDIMSELRALAEFTSSIPPMNKKSINLS
jgi:hypothetical protein